MFDVLIRYGTSKKNESMLADLTGKHVNQANVQTYFDGKIYMEGISHNLNENSWFECNDYLLVVIGDIIPRRSAHLCKQDLLGKALADAIATRKYNVSNIQGNYWIILYIKKNGTLLIVSDPLTVLPLYIGTIKDHLLITTNLSYLKKIGFRLNKRVVLEHILFNQPITKNTLLEDVDSIEPGKRYQIQHGKVTVERPYDLEASFFNEHNDLLDHDEFIADFNHSVTSLSNDETETNLVSLTGGFDSRSIVSTLIRNGLPFITFSFGRKGGPNTETPLLVQKKLGINYEPIYLGSQYENAYVKYAEEVINWSDGLSTFERANYLYAADILRNKATSYLSGLVGGELFAPMSMYVPFCTEYYNNIFFKNAVFKTKDALQSNSLTKFIANLDLATAESLEFVVSQRQKQMNRLSNLRHGYLNLLYDFVTIGFRTFYGGQIHTERAYIHNKIPFYNLDLLERILFSKHKEVFANHFKGSAFHKRRNRILQANIICNNAPDLGAVPTDRGFAPNDLLSSFGKYKSAIQYLYTRRRVKNSEPEFTSAKWSKLYYDYLLESDVRYDDSIFNEAMIREFMKCYHDNLYSKGFNRLLSVAHWVTK